MHVQRYLAAAIALMLGGPAMSQTFLPGNLIVSSTTYAGSAGTVTVGQALPGGGNAIANGSFPNVFTNESVDASFGVTAPIALLQLTQSGALVNSLAISSSQMVTSFASKSELALNISSDGKSVSFMGYNAPVNALDVSNSNTPGLVDPTNPVTSAPASRTIGTVDLSTGALTTTNTNAYSGNNGRAAALVNGTYYTVGNSGNGAKTGPLSALSDNTGVQSIAAGSSGNTTAVGMVQGTYGSATGYQRGFSITQTGAPADKTGKDDNFRGLTVYNGTMYVTKGSGSNGVNTVYQVGANGALSGSGSLSNAPITILPGFSTAAAAGDPSLVQHPFGLFFGNATTLFVADEGDATLGSANGYAGLEEWTFNGTTWSLKQTFTSGLLGSTVAAAAGAGVSSLPWTVYNDGLRNISGEQNADGSWTIFGTTSTISTESTHDQGADPNELVSITIGADSTNANTTFAVLDTAAIGQRLGGVAIAPVPEPGTYALMLAGLGAVGFVAKRRSRTQRARS